MARAAPGRARARRGRRPLLARRARLERPRLAAQRAVGAAAGARRRRRAGRGPRPRRLRCETDLAEFDAHVAAGRLEAAVALHRGPLLADLDDDWVLEARDEHAERLGSVLARLAAAAATPAEAVGWARRRLALDPLDEDAARELMRRMADAGDRAGRARRLRPPVGPAARRARPRAVRPDARARRRDPRGRRAVPTATGRAGAAGRRPAARRPRQRAGRADRAVGAGARRRAAPSR